MLSEIWITFLPSLVPISPVISYQKIFKHEEITAALARKRQWSPIRHLSARTVRNRLKSAGLKSKRVIKRPMLSDRHQRLCLAWCLARRCLNFRTWRRIYWSDESWFVLHVTDGRMRIWRQKNMAYTSRNIQPTVLRWRLSNDMGVYLSWLQVALGHHTRKPNRWSVHLRCLTNSCCSPIHHLLAARPMFMDDKARLHHSRAVTTYLQSEALTSFPWSAMTRIWIR
jgi:hypothetical protein